MTSNDTPDSTEPRSRASPVIARATSALEEELVKPLGPGLYLVATPIGNLADISLRALAALSRADILYCEDTRHSRKLFNHFGIAGEIHAYHDHNADRVRPRILARIAAGQSVALVSDAGTPLISDPGHKLARDVLAAGFPVVSLPGACAAIAALTSAGLPTDRFFFEGFLPPKREARRKRLEALSDIPGTLLFYEAPSRLMAMLEDASEVIGDREGAVARELTKLHESVSRGTFAELAAKAGEEITLKGEFVVLAGPPRPAGVSDSDIRTGLEAALDAVSLRDGVQEVAELLDVPRKRVYKIALALKDGPA